MTRLAAVLLLLLPARAWANAAAIHFTSPENAAGITMASPTLIEVERETLTIACGGDRAFPVCRFEAVYEVRNPSPGAEEAIGAFFGASADQMTITLDGRDVRAALSLEQRLKINELVGGVNLIHPREPRHTTHSFDLPPPTAPTTGFQLQVAAGARARLVFAGRLNPTARDNALVYGGFAVPPNQTRHPVLGSPPERDARHDFTYLLQPLRTWAGARDIAIEVSMPARWRPDVRPLRGGDAWTFTRADGQLVARTRARGADAGTLAFAFTVPHRQVLNGGPFVAVGGEWGRDGGARFRLGYEVAGPAWLQESLALESNGRDQLSIAAVAEAATPSLVFVIPSLALGAGPVLDRRHGDVAPGLRLQASLATLFVSGVLHVDEMFARGRRWTLLGQISF